MKPIERLLFMQGGLCFFCDKPLTSPHASVEHLVARANKGGNVDDNCVACCKSLNGLFGSMPLKQKLKILLNQKGDFKCPNGAQKTTAKVKAANLPSAASLNDKYSKLLKNLEQRGTAKPRTVSKLKTTISALFQRIPSHDVDALVQQLQSRGAIAITGTTITYK